MENIGLSPQLPESLPKLYSIRGITIATALGSCFAGGFLLWLNLKRLNRTEDARNALWFAFAACLILILLLFTVKTPDRFDSLARLVLEGLQVGAVHLYATRVFKKDALTHKENGGQFYSSWRAAGISIPLAAIPISLIVLATLAFPHAPGIQPDDEFYWSVAYHNTPVAKQRGPITWERLQTEVRSYPWLEELSEANHPDGIQPSITVYNPSLDKALTIEVIGTPEDHVVQCDWGEISSEEDYMVVHCDSIEHALPIFHSFFSRDTSGVDSIFNTFGASYRELVKQQSQIQPN